MTDKQTIQFLEMAGKEEAALKKRLAQLILKNHAVIDYTGFEDVQDAMRNYV